MSDFTKAFYNRLANDATLSSLITSYNSAPAIFTGRLVPDDAELPYIVISAPVTDEPFDTKTTRGRDQIRDVLCYGAEEGSLLKLEQIAERVRILFHRHKLSIDNYETVIASASGAISVPLEGASGERIAGLVVSVRILAMEV